MKINDMDSQKIEFLEQNQKPKKGFETIYFILPIVFFFISQIFVRYSVILLASATSSFVHGFYWINYLVSYYFGFIFLGLALVSVFASKWAYEWIYKDDNSENLKSKKIRFVIFSCSVFLSLVLFGGACMFNFIKFKNYQTIFSKKIPVVSAETKSWKTYRNVGYNMELNYPKNWTFIENGETIDFIPMDYPLDKCSLLKNNAYLFHGKGIQLKKISKGEVAASQGSSKTRYKGNGVEIIKFEREDVTGVYVAVVKIGENLFNVEADKESLNIFENIFPTIKNCTKGECNKNFDVAENASCYYLEKYGSAEMQVGNAIKQIIRDWYSNKKTYNGFMEDENNMQKIEQSLEKVKNERGFEVEFYLKTTDLSFVLRAKAKENNKFFYCQDRFDYEKNIIYENKKTGDSSVSLKTKEVGNDFTKINGNNFKSNANCLGVPLENYVIDKPPLLAGYDTCSLDSSDPKKVAECFFDREIKNFQSLRKYSPTSLGGRNSTDPYIIFKEFSEDERNFYTNYRTKIPPYFIYEFCSTNIPDNISIENVSVVGDTASASIIETPSWSKNAKAFFKKQDGKWKISKIGCLDIK